MKLHLLALLAALNLYSNSDQTERNSQERQQQTDHENQQNQHNKMPSVQAYSSQLHNFPKQLQATIPALHSQDEIKQIQAALVVQLKNQGYLKAQVTYKIRNDTAHFYCHSGPQAYINNIKFTGQRFTIRTPYTIPFWKDRFSTTLVASHKIAMLKQLRDLGYFNAQVQHKIQIDKQGSVMINYHINPGDQYHFGEVLNCPEYAVQYIPKGPFKQQALEKFLKQVYVMSEQYRYYNCKVHLQDNKIHIIIDPLDIQSFVITQVTFEGNTRSTTESIQRRLGLRVGDTWNGATIRHLEKRVQALEQNRILVRLRVHPNGHVHFIVQDLPGQIDALGLSASASYTLDEGLDGGVAITFTDKNFLSFGPFTCQASARDSKQGIYTLMQYDNLSGSNISGFACINAYRVNHSRLSEYILQKEQFGNYLKFATGYIDYKAGFTIPLSHCFTVQPYAQVKLSRFGLADVPATHHEIFAPEMFPGASARAFALGMRNTFELDTPDFDYYTLTHDLSVTRTNDRISCTNILGIKWKRGWLSSTTQVGQILGASYWNDNFLNEFHCRLLGAVPRSDLCVLGGKQGYSTTTSATILRKAQWSVSTFTESGCIWNSGVSSPLVTDNDLSLNVAGGLIVSFSVLGTFPFEFVIGSASNHPTGIPLIGCIRCNLNIADPFTK